MVFHRILDFKTRLDFYPASIFYPHSSRLAFIRFKGEPEPEYLLSLNDLIQ